jgi:D-alanyl-D-alanine carboxypeptidase
MNKVCLHNYDASHDASALLPNPVSGLMAVRLLSALLAAALVTVLGAAAPAMANYAPPQAELVIDANTGRILAQRNPTAARYPASLTKVMTLYILFERLRSGALKRSSELKVSADAASRPPSRVGLTEGDTITVGDAIALLITKSANDVAAVVAENLAGSEPAFARLMSQRARELGMLNTRFRNASGLPDPQQTTTARDMITLGQRILQDFPEYAGEFRRISFTFRGKVYRNHNRLVRTYEGTSGLKTGFIRASGFNVLTSVQRGNKRLIAVVIGGRSSAARDARMRQLLDSAWAKAEARDAPRLAFKLDHLPVRNPAFRPTSTERDIRSRMAAVMPEASPARDTDNAADIGSASHDQGDGPGPADAQLAGPYHLQVGAYMTKSDAQARLDAVGQQAHKLLSSQPRATLFVEVSGKQIYRARFGGFDESQARSACDVLKRSAVECLVTRAE